MQAARESRRSAPDVLTGIAVNGGPSSGASWDAKHNSRMETVARQMASSQGPYALEGRVGDCCDDEEVRAARNSSGRASCCAWMSCLAESFDLCVSH